MLTRCSNPNRDYWHRYGGRGITVCKRWLSFSNFLEDMGATFDATLTLGRMDNELGYGPGNCRWITNLEQQQNTRRSVVVACRGQKMTVAQWARRIGVSPFTLYDRIRRGLDAERVISSQDQRALAKHNRNASGRFC